MSDLTRCGYVAIVGRPNVGKSTLMNALLGEKVSITSEKPQTTRFQILGIKTNALVQAIYIDTPGLHQDEKRAMNRYMNRLASSVLPDADLIMVVIEALQWTKEDEEVLKRLKKALKNEENQKKERTPSVVLLVNKIDEVTDKRLLLPFLAMVNEKFPFSSIVPISAKKSQNLSELEKVVEAHLPEAPHFFANDQVTDKSLKFQVAEIIREKLMEDTMQEVPYSTTVEVDDWKTENKRHDISVVIWVERDGQKRIIIGKKGERLKRIGIQARKDIERLLKEKIFLRLWVKVKEDWTDNDKALRQLGYL